MPMFCCWSVQGLGQVYIRLAFQSDHDGQEQRSTAAGGSMRGATGMKKITAKAGWGALQGKAATDHKLRKAQGGCDLMPFPVTYLELSHMKTHTGGPEFQVMRTVF